MKLLLATNDGTIVDELSLTAFHLSHMTVNFGVATSIKEEIGEWLSREMIQKRIKEERENKE